MISKKNKIPIFLALIILGIFSIIFISKNIVSAQTENDIVVETTGYSVVGPTYFVFGGYYSGNVNKRGFTTYFEFKKNDSNLDDEENRQETIEIVRKTNVDEANDFYIGPELNIFSTYYFRAVGYLNDYPNEKFYGETMTINTGYIPVGYNIPFTIGADNNPIPYIPPVCNSNQNLVNGICVDKNQTTTKSSAKSILTFDVMKNGTLLGIGDIDNVNNKVILDLKHNKVDISALAPTIAVSLKANVSPLSGVPKNFNNKLIYRVTAEDGSKKNYSVSFLKSPIEFSIKNVTKNSVEFLAKSTYINQDVSLTVNNSDPATPIYSNISTAKTNIEGNALISFSGLSPSGHYEYTDGVSSGGFSTLSSDNNGDNGDNGGNSGDGGNTGGSINGDSDTGYESDLIPCGTKRYSDFTYKDKTTGNITESATRIDVPNSIDISRQVSNPCGFKHLLIMINKVINYVLFVLVIPIAAILFAYAGFMMITSGGSPEQRSKAIKVFKDAGIGLVLIAAAWLIISTILQIVGFDGSWIGF
jgi:hypothetical protein